VGEAHGAKGGAGIPLEYKAGLRWEPNEHTNIALTHGGRFDGVRGSASRSASCSSRRPSRVSVAAPRRKERLPRWTFPKAGPERVRPESRITTPHEPTGWHCFRRYPFIAGPLPDGGAGGAEGNNSPRGRHATRSSYATARGTECGARPRDAYLFVIVNFAPEMPRSQPEPVPESASETSPW